MTFGLGAGAETGRRPFNAGLGVRMRELRGLLRGPGLLGAGLLAGVAVPLAFLFAVAAPLRFWHDPDEAQCLLLGLTLVAAMPAAASSAAWAQRAEGDLALSLGMVLGSTLLSPWATPVVLAVVIPLTTGVYAEVLGALAGADTGIFLALWVPSPSLLGVLVGLLLGEARLSRWRAALKLANSACLLVLLYANAALALPQALGEPDPDFLALAVILAVGLCAGMFAAGWLLGKVLKADRARQASLTFGLGMSNNGTGLVLASLGLAAYPRAMLPLILYNLAQHLAAGTVERWLGREPGEAPADRRPLPPPVGAVRSRAALRLGGGGAGDGPGGLGHGQGAAPPAGGRPLHSGGAGLRPGRRPAGHQRRVQLSPEPTVRQACLSADSAAEAGPTLPSSPPLREPSGMVRALAL
jgi:BASS family bile acid:Na+ symporter